MTEHKSLPTRFSAFVATQAFGAFNDNFFKTLLQLFVLQIMAVSGAERLISIATLAFTIPFVFFGPWAGYFSDKYSKTTVMILVKGGEILIMILGILAFFAGSVPWLIVVLFLMAAQSTFFSPAKSGIIPEICHEESITRANSWVEMTTFVAILLGTALTGLLLSLHHNKASLVSLYCVAVAIFGTLSSLLIPRTKAAGREQPFPWNPVRGIVRDLLFLKRQKGLFLASLANSYFWLLGLIFSTNILVYGKNFLHLTAEDNVRLSFLPAYLGIGIAAGSLLAGRWSGKKVELGLVPLGGLGMAFAGIALCFTFDSYLSTALVLFFSGVSGGLYIVPLYAYLQFEAKPNEKGRVLATAGVLNGLFLVLGALLYHLLAVVFAVQAPVLYLIMGVVTIGVVIYICTIIPEYLIRFVAWLLTHTFYRIRIIGSENVPFHGPALLVPNHVSFVDALLVGATIQRFIKFIMYKKYFEFPILKRLCAIMEVIPIAPYEGRESVGKSLDTAREKLIAGEVVCIFAEGKITRDGHLDEFRPGFETIMNNLTCPIIPVYLHNVWGSIFSFEGGKSLWKIPKWIPYPVTVSYGHPLPPDSKATDVESAVRALEEKTKGVS